MTTGKRAQRKPLLWLVVLLTLSAFLNMIVALSASVTYDETLHVEYGQQILHGEPDRLAHDLRDSQMPISALNAVPLEIIAQLQTHHMLPRLSMQANLVTVRVATLLATLVLGLLVYLWAYELYGQGPAFASCILCLLSPTLIAHGTLATTDMFHALSVVAALFFFRRFLLQPTTRNAVISGLMLALAQLTKSFAIALYITVGLAFAYAMFRRDRVPRLSYRRVLLFAAIAAFWFVAVINVGFCFDRTFQPLSSYLAAGQHRLENTPWSRIQRLPAVGLIPVPFPYPFVQGLVLMRGDEQTGSTFGNIYLLGQLRDPSNPAVHGFKSYYAVAYLFKEPIALQILFLWGLVWICRNRKLDDIATGEGLLLAAAAILVVWLSFFSKAQIGIRHILPAVAIVPIIAGAAFSNFSSKSRVQKISLCALVVWMAVSVASYYPQMIPYMNEWVHDRRFSYRYLADSNLDWGQDADLVEKFLKKNPDVVLDPATRVAGRILVGANCLTQVYPRNCPAAWANHYDPVSQVGYAHFLFIIPAADVPPGSH